MPQKMVGLRTKPALQVFLRLLGWQSGGAHDRRQQIVDARGHRQLS